MVHHALYQKQNYSYAGVIEALSGAPFDVKFISFDDIKADPKVLDGIDVLINVGDGDTAHTGGNAIILGGSYDIDRKNIDKLINLRSYYKITGKHPGYRKFERREKGEPTDK